MYNECNCLSFAAWNCAARAPGSMPVRALPEIDVSGHGLPYSGFNILLTYNVIFKCSLNIFT